MKATTEQIKASENKSIILKMDFETVSAVYEELGITEKSLRSLVQIADTTEDEKLRASIYQWLIELRIPKPKQSLELDGGMEIVITERFTDEHTITEDTI